MKRLQFKPGHIYRIEKMGNNGDALFYEPRNFYYFLSLFKKHLRDVAVLEAFSLSISRFELVLRFQKINMENPLDSAKLNRKMTNFLIAYSKSINKAYNRSGSLFRELGKREELSENQAEFHIKRLGNNLPF